MKHFVARPLVANVPDPGKGYELENCPLCGAEVWKRPIEKKLNFISTDKIEFTFICTICALKNAPIK